MNSNLPKSISKFFWGDDLKKISWAKNKQYIIKNILEKGDLKNVSWLLQKISKNNLRSLVNKISLDAKSHNFWKSYFS